MPIMQLPISGPAYQNTDDQMLDKFSAEIRNLYVNRGGYSEKRDGLTSWVNLGTSRSIDALYWWETQQVVLAVSNGELFKITDSLGTTVQLTTGDKLAIGVRTVIDDNGTTAVLANGGGILTTSISGPAVFHPDSDAPSACTHVAFHDQYLLYNNAGTGTWGISEVADYATIRAIDIFSAETRPDKINSIYIGLGEIVFFGAKTIEFWVNDGVTPFSRISQATIERGVSAPYSPVLANDRWLFLDHNRKVVEIQGRRPVEVSDPVDKIIQGMAQVDGAFGQVYHMNGWPLYVLNFPQASRTLVYNYLQQDWSEWDYFNQTQGTMERYRGNAYCYAIPWNLHLVGDYENGIIYTSSNGVYQDNSNVIKCRRRSGFVTHGTFNRKVSHRVNIRLKQSVATTAVPNPYMTVRWRDENGAWTQERWIDLGPVGDHNNVVSLTQLGTYRSRQWEIGFTENAPFVLGDAQEDVELLSS